MNENDLANVPPPIAPNPEPVPPPIPSSARPFSWWFRKLFACNPFYLVSAALLLYGCYRVSIDAPFFNRETARLLFTFSSVQAYEILLVLVGIFLAGRRLWYDSTLLVGLENLLVFVPFILISQAALTDAHMTAAMCAVGVTLAILRFGSLKKYFTGLNLPGRLLGAGFILLAVNVALPLIYLHIQQTKYGTYLEYGPAYEMNERIWLLVLPVLFALANVLPRAEAKGDLLPQHRWLPTGLFSLWIIVTCVHLYALDYVFEYYIRSELCAPAAWVLAWTIFLRCPANLVRLKYALMFPALLTPLVAASPGGAKILLVLNGLNIAAYGAVILLNRSNRFALHLAYASALLLVASLPDNWMQFIYPGLAQSPCVAAGLVAYLVLWTAWQRNPKLAVVGSIILGYGLAAVLDGRDWGIHVALQGTFVFLLLHSLRWNEKEHPDAGRVRMLIGVAWAIASFVWVNTDAGKFWMPLVPGAMVLAIYCLCLPCRGIWRLFVVPTTALIVMSSGPCSATISGVFSMPIGLLAVSASFLFLGVGTLTALTRHLWHKHEQELKAEPSRAAVMSR
jgi:hypothetical protein